MKRINKKSQENQGLNQTENGSLEPQKRLSAFAKGMMKYAGTVQIVDMRAVMR